MKSEIAHQVPNIGINNNTTEYKRGLKEIHTEAVRNAIGNPPLIADDEKLLPRQTTVHTIAITFWTLQTPQQLPK